MGGLCACVSTAPVPDVSIDGLDAEVRTAIQTARADALAQPKSGQASGRLGMVLQVNEIYGPAVLVYQRAIRLEPKEFAWRYYQAQSLQLSFQLEAALAAIDEALRLRPDYTPAIVKRAELLFKLGRIKEADAALEPALTQNPGAAPVLFLMAQIKSAEQDFHASEDLYHRACEAAPTYGAAWRGLAEAVRRSGHSADSARYLQLADNYKDNTPLLPDELSDEVRKLATGIEPRLRLAKQYMDQRRFDDATRLYKEVLRTHPDHPECLENLLYMAQFPNQSSPEEVEAYYAAAVRVSPESAHVYLYYGTALAGQGKYDAAVAAIEKAIARKPNDPDAHVWLADVRERQHRPALAIEQYRLALAAQPDFRPARLELGKLLLIAGHSREAIDVLLPTVQAQDRNTAEAMMLMTQAYANLGDREHVRQYLEQARAAALKNGPPELLPLIEQGLMRVRAGR
jgi:tetratricopeptide (TPR) repeat protein